VNLILSLATREATFAYTIDVRHPPSTGLGLNTAVQDAQNIAFKLTAVLNDLAPPSVLDTYETERRPIGIRNCDWALHAFDTQSLANFAMGIKPGGVCFLLLYSISRLSLINLRLGKMLRGRSRMYAGEHVLKFQVAVLVADQVSSIKMATLWDDTEIAACRRAVFEDVMKMQRLHFACIGVELSSTYDKGWFVPDGAGPPKRDAYGTDYYRKYMGLACTLKIVRQC
jgi:2,4-dichlorophenol 6-monooxygenase